MKKIFVLLGILALVGLHAHADTWIGVSTSSGIYAGLSDNYLEYYSFNGDGRFDFNIGEIVRISLGVGYANISASSSPYSLNGTSGTVGFGIVPRLGKNTRLALMLQGQYTLLQGYDNTYGMETWLTQSVSAALYSAFEFNLSEYLILSPGIKTGVILFPISSDVSNNSFLIIEPTIALKLQL
jgi:hypothetical protein